MTVDCLLKCLPNRTSLNWQIFPCTAPLGRCAVPRAAIERHFKKITTVENQSNYIPVSGFKQLQMHLKSKHTKEKMPFFNFAFGKFRKSPEYPCFAQNYSSPQCNYVMSWGACLYKSVSKQAEESISFLDFRARTQGLLGKGIQNCK